MEAFAMVASSVLPPNSERPILPETLRDLLRDALRAYLEYESQFPTNRRATRVFVLHGTRARQDQAALPRYEWIPSRAEKALCLAEIKMLLDYLWGTGRCRVSFEAECPKRFSWDICVLSQWLFVFLTRALAKQARCDAILGKPIVDYRLEPGNFELCIDLLANEIATGLTRCVAQTVLYGVSGIEDRADLAAGIELCPFSGFAACEFLSRAYPGLTEMEQATLDLAIHHAVLLSVCDDLPIRSNGAYWWGCRQYVNQALAVRVNAAKWAMATACGKPAAPEESPVFMFDPMEGQATPVLGDALRRDGRGRRPSYKLSKEILDTASRNLERILRTAPKSADLFQALWYWGRSATQPHARDAVLDAVCGLELLLVKGSGENSFRFRLNGAALLGTVRNRTEIVKDLKKVYGSRSTAAHGGGFKTTTKDADLARGYLSIVITEVLNLHDAGTIDACKENVAQQIQELVIAGAGVR